MDMHYSNNHFGHGYDLDRLNFRVDERWAHPELTGSWTAQEQFIPTYTMTYNPEFPKEQRKKETHGALQYFIDLIPPKDPSICQEYDFPGYEIEGAWGHVTVTRPKGVKPDKKTPAIFCIPAGGLYMCLDSMVPDELLAETFKATVIAVRWRDVFEEGGNYPGTIDDVDNAYKWVIDHADELHINPKRIVIWGESSGGHLALAISHRLKNKEVPYYGYMPRGVIAFEPITDDRTIYLNSGRACLAWDSNCIFASGQAWLGYEWQNPAYVPAEAFPNHATPEDCVGLPPTKIHTGDAEPCVDSQMEYVGKLIRAGVYCDLHVWGGCNHSALHNYMKTPEGRESPYCGIYWQEIQNDVRCFLRYDMTRPFVQDILDGKAEPRQTPTE